MEEPCPASHGSLGKMPAPQLQQVTAKHSRKARPWRRKVLGDGGAMERVSVVIFSSTRRAGAAGEDSAVLCSAAVINLAGSEGALHARHTDLPGTSVHLPSYTQKPS